MNLRINLRDNLDQNQGLGIIIIFEKFRQVDASHTRTHMGTGLGLAICRDLVDMLQGELWLQSSDGAGTTFFVALDVVYTSRAPQTLMGVQHNSPAE